MRMFSPSLIPLYTCVCQGTGSFYSHRTSKEDHVLLPVQVYKAPTYTATHQHRSYFMLEAGRVLVLSRSKSTLTLLPTTNTTFNREEISLHNPKPPTKANILPSPYPLSLSRSLWSNPFKSSKAERQQPHHFVHLTHTNRISSAGFQPFRKGTFKPRQVPP